MFLAGSIDEKDEADLRLSFPFQGKEFHPCKRMIYWFRWGEWTFDIREIRKVYNRKPSKAIDVKFDMHPCSKFRNQMMEIINLVGDEPFEKVMDKAREQMEYWDV